MTNMVGDFIEKNKEALQHQLLDDLELYEFEKKYAPENYNLAQARYSGYTQSETVDGVTRYYKNGEKIYPQISDDEYEKLLTISREKEYIAEMKEADRKKQNPPKKQPYHFNIAAVNASGECFAAKFMNVLVWVLWIGGLIVSIITSITGTVFQWSLFIPSLVMYFAAGAICMCMAQVFENIQIIASAIQRFHATDERK